MIYHIFLFGSNSIFGAIWLSGNIDWKRLTTFLQELSLSPL